MDEEQQARYDWDYRLVQLSLAGDETACEILYSNTFPIAKRTVHKFDPQQLLTEQDAEDIAAEALLCCYQKREEFEPRNLFSTWVGGFVHNITLRYRAKYHRYRLEKEETIFYESLKTTADPLRIMLRKERNFYMWLTLEGMDETGRILMWHDLGRYTTAQVRKKTGLRRDELEQAAENARHRYCCAFWAVYPGYHEA